MKAILTEKQFKQYIEYIVERSIMCEGASNATTINNLKTKLTGRINDLASKDSEFADTARAMGVNPTYNDDERGRLRRNLGNSFKNGALRDSIANDALILSRYVGLHSKFDAKQMKSDYPNEFNRLMRVREFLDSKGLTWLYNIQAVPSDDGVKFFGYSPEDKTIEDRIAHFNFDVIGKPEKFYKIKPKDMEYYDDEDIEADRKMAPIRMKESMLNNYINKTYGLEISLPGDVFKAGNLKLPEGTLILNFTAALQCPAWNECLLREACYARNSEKQYGTQRNANVKKNLMWEAGHKDPVIMDMIGQLLRLYVVNYDKAVLDIKKITGKTYMPANLAKIKFSDIKDEALLQVFKNNTSITHIRLNENGDFIGDWLLDEINTIAGDFMLIGIDTSAYTCRNLDYTRASNIIINASNAAIKKGKIDRYFFAIEENMYNAFDETYGGNNNSLEIIDGSVQPNPQPLYTVDENGQVVDSGHLYYKCPCGRPLKGKEKISCYQCDVCYHRNTFEKPTYVLVKIHSNGEGKTAGMPHVTTDKNGYSFPNFGFSRNWFKNTGRTPQEYLDRRKENSEETTLKESINRGVQNGILQIAKNCINSVKDHLAKLAGK